MGSKMQKVGLVVTGAVIGVLISLNFSAIADKPAPAPLPVEELRTFSEIFGRIKTDYVEPVEDKKLIKEAITGMVSGLDPHSAYLDAESFKELQVGTQGEFGGLGSEVGAEEQRRDAGSDRGPFDRVQSRSEIRRSRHQA